MAGRPTFKLRVAFTGLGAVFQGLLRRARHGPTLPSWTLSEELLVSVSRSTAKASARHIELMAPRGSGFRVPLDASSRAALIVEQVDLGGVPAERFCPKSSPSERSSTSMAVGSCPAVSGLNADLPLQTPLPPTAIRSASNTAWHPITRTPQRSTTPSRPTRPCSNKAQHPATVVLFGASAGACLALSSLLKLRDLGLPQPAGAVLLWPYADFTFSGETIRSNGDLDMLPVRDLAHIWGPAYVGDADPSDPLVSPALADLTGLAPLLIIAGGAESLLSCAERIAANARRDGVSAQLSVFPKVHGWMMLPKLDATRQAIEEINGWIAERLGHEPDPVPQSD